MDKELFNPKTVEMLCSKIKLTPLQKKSSREWLYFLEEGKLKQERLNYPKFMIIVLQNLLGYDIKNMNHEEGNIEFSFKNKSGDVVLGIEAKGTKTKDLFAEQKGYRESHKTPIDQLWTYMGKLDLNFGIATNYKTFILLDKSKGSSTYHSFDFGDIQNNEQKLKEFVAIFSKEQIIDNQFIQKLEEESAIEERIFTKEFYKLFHETRLMLIKEFQENGLTKDEAIHFAQLSLNRLMFVFFAEDTEKLDIRLFEEEVISGLKSEMLISDQSKIISDIIQSMFLRLNKGSTTPRKIFGFNGGLFEEEIPSNAYFKDFRNKNFFKEIYQYSKLKKEPELDEYSKRIFNKYKNRLNPIIKNLLILASFDFKTEVSVNILGHIFEQSLTDLEELKGSTISKRRKEGIFYTPEYVTDYICRNTIIPYLSKHNSKDPRSLVLEYETNIKELEGRLVNLKILDPACGSGAFLIKAVDILLDIHKEIQLFKEDKGEYTVKKKGKKKDSSQLVLAKWHDEEEARDIIEKNIYGVDINEESIEITKLSLFFKVARRNKKLLDLSQNIRCGNSLVDNKETDSKAFNWNKEFPFEFDIIIGNPPYVRADRLKGIKQYFEEHYKSYTPTADLYTYFYERGLNLIKSNGKLGYISSNKFVRSSYGINLRKFLSDYQIERIIDFGELPVFEDASTFPSIFLINKSEPKLNTLFAQIKDLNFTDLCKLVNKISTKVSSNNFKKESWSFSNDEEEKILEKMKEAGTSLKDYTNDSIFYGIKTGFNEAFIINKSIKDELINEDKKSSEIIKPIIFGDNIRKYRIDFEDKYIILTKIGVNIKNYPAIFKHLSKYKEKLKKRVDKGEQWWELRHCAYYDLFEKPKIHIPAFALESRFAYDNEGLYSNAPAYIIPLDDKYLLAILNSKVVWFFLRTITPVLGDENKRGRLIIRTVYFEKLPIPKCENKKPLIEKADLMIKLNKDFYKKKNNFLKLIKQEYNVDKISKKLDNFYEIDFDVFIKQLSIKELTISKKSELLDFFEKNKKELLELKEEIDKLDEEINDLVYDLYNVKEYKEIIKNSLT